MSKEVVLKRYRPGADLSAGREPQYFSGIEQLEPRVLMSASVIGAEAMYPLADSALIQGDALTRGAIEFASPFVADTGATVIRRYTDRIDEQPAALDTGIGTASMAMTATGGVDIVITPGSTLAANQAAVDAFERAAAQWEAFLQDTITVNVLADLGSLPPTVLGSTNTVRAFKSASYGFNTVRNAMVADASGDVDDAIVAYLPTAAQLDWNVPSGFGLINGLAGAKANMKALGFDPAVLETDFGFYDGSITFNSSWAFDYDNSDGVTAGTIDFETVAAHELGHLLGFVSDVNYADSLLRTYPNNPVCRSAMKAQAIWSMAK